MSGEGGPFRETDPVIDRLDKIIAAQDRHGVALGDVLDTRKPRSGVLETIAPWFGSPLIILAFLYGTTLVTHSCNSGCATQARDDRQAAQAAAASELHDRERYCAAIGMRFAGLTPVHQDPPQDRFGTPGETYYSVVCGDGHGNGMFVGADGHLHALRSP